MNREDNYINHFLDRKVKITFFDNTTDIGILVKNDNVYRKEPYKLIKSRSIVVFFKSYIKKIEPYIGGINETNRV